MSNDIGNILNDVVETFKNKRNKNDVAILFTDLRASTQMKMELDEKDSWRNVIYHNIICKKNIEKSNGIVIKYIGDSVMGRFNLTDKNLIEEVINCAINIQKEVNELHHFDSKISINICRQNEAFEIMQNDLIGFPVDVTARMNEMAKARQILISERIVDLLKGINSTKLADISQPVSKNIRGTKAMINVYELGLRLEDASNPSYLGINTDQQIKTMDDISNSINMLNQNLCVTFSNYMSIYNKFYKYDIIDILQPTNEKFSNTNNVIDNYLSNYLNDPDKPHKVIKAYGIALRRMFSPEGVFKKTILQKGFQGSVDFRAIILNPSSEAAKTRSIVEGANKCDDNIKPEECIVFQDITLSKQMIEFLKKSMGPDQFKVKTTNFLPQMKFLMTDEVLFFEQYHIGKKDPLSVDYHCLGGSVPTIQTGNRSYWYKYFNYQFDYLWTITKNDRINEFFGMDDV